MPLHGAEIESEKQALPPTSHKSYKVLIISNLFFVLASTFYLAAAAYDVQENKTATATSTVTNLTPSVVLQILGGLAFVVVGLLDLYNTQKKVHFFLTLAGLFAALRGFYLKSNYQLSSVFNMLSAHLFLLESLDWIYSHFVKLKLDDNDSRKSSLLVAEAGDAFFFLGALMDCIFSWIDIFKAPPPPGSAQGLASASGDVVSGILWLLAALISTVLACRLGKQGFAGASGEGASMTAASGSMA
ncbi:expressed unknown protein [Seminavis robusta]|uniref:Uncharacterized protein n=1 Tax=Seminavis robusta TaxID=568900 RepID=A0A9N8ESQ5_9STRA|nr:expressed unknown protein [Seminavis robusta]|eukprot:Sro1716_g293220.1 n/a (244) ;mRNA; f:21839-22570